MYKMQASNPEDPTKTINEHNTLKNKLEEDAI